MLEFTAPEIIEVFNGRTSFKSAAKSEGKETLKKQLGSGSKQNPLNNPVGHEETFLQTFLVDHVKQQFSVPNFCGTVWKSWRESPNC